MRLWGGRFGDGPDARMADFTRSIEVDAELALDDVAASIAHVRGLARAGLVTAEELAEEVMGRLTDEWVKEEPSVSTVSSGVFEIDAQSRVDEVNEALGLDLPSAADYDTVAGFLLFEIRRIPRVGEVIAYRDLRFTVLEMAGPKIERLRVEQV